MIGKEHLLQKLYLGPKDPKVPSLFYIAKKNCSVKIDKFLTLNLLQNLLFGNIDPLKGLSNLLLPQRDELVMSQDIGRWPQIQGLVQGSRIVRSFDRISPNVIFIHKDS